MRLEHIDGNNDFDFGKTGENYALYRDIYPKSMFDRLISYGIGKKGQRILDLGSGTAILPINLYYTGALFTATDISEGQIEYGRRLAAEKGMDDIRFKVCPAEDTGFDDYSFDAVTAVQCFPYFDADRASAEIQRILKPGGLLCVILMDWLPDEDEVIAEMIQTVKRYNPNWSEKGFTGKDSRSPRWAEGRFERVDIFSYDTEIGFSREAWLGRTLSCRGVGASLPPEEVSRFKEEYRSILEKYDEQLTLKHRIHMEMYRSLKES